MVDTEATCTLFSRRQYCGPISGYSINSMGIDGVPITCPKTFPLKVTSPMVHTFCSITDLL